MNRRRDEAGAVAIMVALCATVLFVIAALVVDLGFARDVRRQSQNAADASALAAANVLYPATRMCSDGTASPCFVDAVATAKTYAEQNFDVDPTAAWGLAACSDAGELAYTPAGDTQCISFDSQIHPTKVRVRIPTRDVLTGLGALADVQSIPITSAAGAALSNAEPTKCGLCFLGSVDAGNADFSVSPGSIAVNGSISAGPQSIWNATGGAITVSAATSEGGPDVSGGQFTPAVTSGPTFTDPYASLVLPSTTGLTALTDPCATTQDHGNGNGNGNGNGHGNGNGNGNGAPASGEGPGLYGDVSISGTCTLQPGIYIISGTWALGNTNAKLEGTGVTLYFTTGTLDGKNGGVSISAPTTGPTSGFAIIYDRDNATDIHLRGNGGTSVTGKVYAKSSALEFNGNSCFRFVGGPIVVAGVVKANGNHSCVEIANAIDIDVASPPPTISLDQ